MGSGSVDDKCDKLIPSLNKADVESGVVLHTS